MVENNYVWLIVAVDEIAKIREPVRYEVEGVFPWKILAEYWKKIRFSAEINLNSPP